MDSFSSIFSAAIFLTMVAGASAAEPPPLGHKDFYPSPQRPVGFRGDGNACFPGARPVAEFWDGTPAQVDRPLMAESFGNKLDLKGKTAAKIWDVTDEKSKNIVWKTRLPGWSLADPVVVGDRVFAVGEPDWLTCVDAHSGKVLWQTRVLSLLCDGKTPEEAARHQQVIDIAAVFNILKGGHASSVFAGCHHGSASWFGGLMGSMTPSGNRLFIQSAAHLRCIGDPAVQYDWNPQSRPAHITTALKSKDTLNQGAVAR